MNQNQLDSAFVFPFIQHKLYNLIILIIFNNPHIFSLRNIKHFIAKRDYLY